MTRRGTSEIRAERLVVGHGPFRTPALSFAVVPGEVVALVGPSGAGKTSILRAVGGLAEPRAGRVVVEGLGRAVVCFQEPRLLPWRTVEQNLLFALGRRSEPRSVARALELLEQLGLHDMRRRTPAQLSGGQRRRVAIARTLMADSRAVLIDEPFVHLDRDAGRLVRDAIRERAMTGSAMIVAVHSTDESGRVADRAISIGPAASGTTAP